MPSVEYNLKFQNLSVMGWPHVLSYLELSTALHTRCHFPNIAAMIFPEQLQLLQELSIRPVDV